MKTLRRSKGALICARGFVLLVPLADSAVDEPTADLLTQGLTVHEQTVGMLRSMLEG